MQTKGNSNTNYTLKYKKTSSGHYTTHRSFKFPANNRYYGPFALFHTTGTPTYNFHIVKTNYLSTPSNLKVDFILN